MSVYQQTLKRAAEIVGDDEALAQLLGATREQLLRWLAGEERPPMEVFLRAVDIVVKESVSRNRKP
jgi:DNA-binding transcriptional regulator YdaS (Cro superfamily)